MYIANCGTIDIPKFINQIVNVVQRYVTHYSASDKTEVLWDTNAYEIISQMTSHQDKLYYANNLMSNKSDFLSNFDTSMQFWQVYRKGMLIITFPDISFSDGTAMKASGGYFDDSDFPPPATWLLYVNDETFMQPRMSHIVSWVPSKFCANVKEAILYNPSENVINFLDANIEICYRDLLAKHGLLI